MLNLVEATGSMIPFCVIIEGPSIALVSACAENLDGLVPLSSLNEWCKIKEPASLSVSGLLIFEFGNVPTAIRSPCIEAEENN